MPAPSQDDLEPLRQWFREWEITVRNVDFASARRLFEPGVISFGTHAEIVSGIDALEAQQWRAIWPRIADFRFRVDSLQGEISGDRAWAAVPWTSTGFDEAGAVFDRPGRATVILHRDGERWRGVHTHFSVAPGTPQRTHGRPKARAD